MKRTILVLLVLSVTLLGACSSPEKSTTLPEPSIPSHYAVYTDDGNVFNISYPPDWQVNLSLIEDVNFQEYMEKAWEASGERSAPEAMFSMVLFLAGVPTGRGGYSPNASVAVLPLSGKETKLDDIVDETIGESTDLFAEYTVFSRTRTTADGREAVIKETEAYYPGMERVHQLHIIMVNDKIIWFVTCTSNPEEFAKYEDDFYHIVRSLRILK